MNWENKVHTKLISQATTLAITYDLTYPEETLNRRLLVEFRPMGERNFLVVNGTPRNINNNVFSVDRILIKLVLKGPAVKARLQLRQN
jgi:hypothetical protein